MTDSHMESARKPSACPNCGSRRIENILYGDNIDTPEIQTLLRVGKIEIGGAVATDNDPAWKCLDCGEGIWRQKHGN